tara:strand:- start:1893 stop:2249 length:357 start_codon:yes stop_codon:yes gene_type:complete
MSQKQLTNRQRFDIESFIAQHGDELELGWQYHDGWSDNAVSKHCGATKKTVANIRYRTFGNLANHASRSTGKMTDILQRLEVLEARLSALGDTTETTHQTWIDEPSKNGLITGERACL